MERGADLPPKKQDYNPRDGKNYLFVIGIDKYQHWSVLHNAVRDAKDFIQVLTSQYQFEQEDVHCLYNEQATESNIYQEIRALKREITSNDNLLVYYSGHGYYDEDFDEGHWIPVDASPGTEDRYISNANIIKRINAIDAHHILMVIDSCFSGSLVVANRSVLIDEHYRSRRIFSSGRLETVSDGKPGENSPFASLLLTRLKKNTDQAVTTTDLIQYVKKTIGGRSRQAPVDGRIQNSQDEGGEFIFHLKVSEADLWKNVQQENTAAAYENYLNYYPDGLYLTSARRNLLKLKEEEVWNSAKAKDNETAYRDYLQKYAGSGKYLSEAQERLTAIQEKFKQRREMLEQLAQKDAEKEDIQKKFHELIQKAEGLFDAKKLEEARDYYRESLQYYMQGLAPSYDYIEQQINFCTNGIAFLQYYQNGKEAMNKGNYRLAIQYFTEANNTSEDPRVEDLIKVCRQRLERPSYTRSERKEEEEPAATRGGVALGASPAVATPAPPRKKKKRYTWVLFLLLGFIGAVVILAIIGNNMDTGGDSYSYPSSDQGINLGLNDGSSPPTNEEMILGAWSVTDLTTNGVSISEMGPEYRQMLDMMSYQFTFQNNNTVLLSTSVNTEQQNYYVSGNAITIQSFEGPSNGTIEYLDEYSMQITFYMPDGYGNTYPLTIHFER